MIEHLEWDSKFFEKKIGKYHYTDKTDKDLFYKIAQDFDLVYLFSNKPIKINARLADIKVTFSKEICYHKSNLENIFDFDNKKHDYNELLKLAYLSGHDSRFFKDDFFTLEQFKLMYKTWIDNNLKNDRVLIYYNNNEIAGFISYTVQNTKAIIQLVAVSKKFQGQGIGKLLIQSLENSLNEKILLNVATQESNQAAYNFYKNYGFNLFQKQFIYHYEPNSF